jgi:uncharacterized membrane protein
MPVHYNLMGRADRYGGRFEGLFVMPLVAVFLYLLMLALPRLDPGRANYPAFAGAYATVRLAVVAVMAVVYGFVQLTIRGYAVSLERWVPLMLGALFIVIGNVLGKVRPNWFFGIRTPWTLSSKLAWTRTHRAGGWVFVGVGMLTLLAGMLKTDWAMAIMIASVVAAALGLTIYSYVLWRRDPDKTPPAGTLPAG